MVRAIVIATFGVIPSFILCLLAGIGLGLGLELVLEGSQVIGFVVAIWALSMFWGTVALTRAMIGHPTNVISRGLVALLVALLIFLYLLVGDTSYPALVFMAVGLSPLLVAVTLLLGQVVVSRAKSESGGSIQNSR